LAPVAAVANTDPVAQLTTDLAHLSTDVSSVHDSLLADLTKVTTDAGKGDKAAAKVDLKQFRSDRGERHAVGGPLDRQG
jgi:hypothetical protein